MKTGKFHLTNCMYANKYLLVFILCLLTSIKSYGDRRSDEVDLERNWSGNDRFLPQSVVSDVLICYMWRNDPKYFFVPKTSETTNGDMLLYARTLSYPFYLIYADSDISIRLHDADENNSFGFFWRLGSTIPSPTEREEGSVTDLYINNKAHFENIGAYWFEGSRDLKSVEFIYDAGNPMATIKYIGKAAFKNCVYLANLYHFENHPIEIIGESAFENCKRLTWINLGSSLKEVGDRAFASMEKLNSLSTYAPVPNTGRDVFLGSSIGDARLQVKPEHLKAYMNADQWKDFGYFQVFGNSEMKYYNVKHIDIAGPDYIFKEESIQLSLEISPKEASFKKVFWSSSDPTIATVDENGTVTGREPGTVIIKAISEYGNREDIQVITVHPWKTMKLNMNSIKLKLYEVATIKADEVPFGPSPEWVSSNPGIIQMKMYNNEVGIMANAVGSTKVKATVIRPFGRDSAECFVTVEDIEREIILSDTLFKGFPGDEFQLYGSLTPMHETIEWSVRDPGKVHIESTRSMCDITLKNAGETEVIARAPLPLYGPRENKVCKIKVWNDSFGLDSAKINGNRGDTVTITGSFIDTVFNTKYPLQWAVKDPSIASINPSDISCEVVLLKKGETEITASFRDSIKVVPISVDTVVIPPKVLDLKLSARNKKITVGESFMLTVSVKADPENSLVFWERSNSCIELVQYGNYCSVMGLLKGSTTIFATSLSDPTYKDSCTVLIETNGKDQPVFDIVASKLNRTADFGEEVILEPVIYPDVELTESIVWTTLQPVKLDIYGNKASFTVDRELTQVRASLKSENILFTIEGKNNTIPDMSKTDISEVSKDSFADIYSLFGRLLFRGKLEDYRPTGKHEIVIVRNKEGETYKLKIR